MLKTRTMSGANRSTAFAVAVGLGVSLVIMLLLSVGMTSLLVNGRAAEGTMDWLVFVIRLVAVLLGTLVGSGIVNEKLLLSVGLIVLGNLFLLLGMGIVIYDGSFNNFGAGVVSIIIGGILSFLIRLKLQNKPRRAKRIKR